MEKILDFIKKYGLVIIITLCTISLFKSCGIKNECNKNKKALTELTNELNKKDSLLEETLNKLNHKLDSTLISNSAVVNSNNETNNALNRQKQQQVVVKLLPNKE